MGLTAELLDTLGRCGFEVMPKPFDGGKHFCRRGTLRASIDTCNERLSLWGTTRVLTLAEAVAEFAGDGMPPANAEAALPVPVPTLTPLQQAWLDRCLRAGIRILDGPRPPAANCSAESPDGQALVLLPWSQAILGVGFRPLSLSDFEQPQEIVTTGRTVVRSLFEEDA